MNRNDSLSVTYSSGVICHDPNILTTLAVFYDKIWFPYPLGLNRKKELNLSAPEGYYNDLSIVEDKYEQWITQWELLFQEGILCILPKPNELKAGHGFQSEMLDQLCQKDSVKRKIKVFHDFDVLSGRLAMTAHALYSPKPSPELFLKIPGLYLWLLDLEDPFESKKSHGVDSHIQAKSTNTSTSELANILASSLFEYYFPKLQSLNAEQVMEVRNYLSNTKQGFIDYLLEMTDDVESRLISGTNSIDYAAKKTMERKFIPHYNEFRRQLEAKDIGFWSKVLEGGGKFLKIDAAFWAPKFYGEIIQILCEIFGKGAEAHLKNLSNKNQAFSYLGKLDSDIIQIK